MIYGIIPFKQSNIHNINYIISKDKSKTILTQYLHGCDFSPVTPTFQKFINKGNSISWSDIENLNFKKLLGEIEATLKDHLNQERRHLRSTKVILNNEKDIIEGNFP